MPDDELNDEAPEESDGGGSRVMWSGTLTFGLVSIPVALLAAVRRAGLPLRMIDAETRMPLARRYYCPAENVEVHPEHIQRGYDMGDGRFIVVRDDELAALEPRKSRDIDLRLFVERGELEPLLFEHSYYLAPGSEGKAGGSAKAYHLLASTLQRRNRAGIATFVMRGKEYFAAILAEQEVLRVQTLRFADEIRDPAAMNVKAHAADPGHVQHFSKLISSLTKPKLEESALHDEQTRRLAELVQAKERRNQDVVQVETNVGGEEATAQDLMAALQRSLNNADTEPVKRKPQPHPGCKLDIDALSLAQVRDRIEEMDVRQLRQLRKREDTHKRRKGVLALLDRQIKRRGAA